MDFFNFFNFFNKINLQTIYSTSIGIGIVLFAIILKKPVCNFINKKILKYFDKQESISPNIIKPLNNLIIIVSLFFAIDFIPFVGKTAVTVNNIAMSFILINVFHAIMLIAEPIVSIFYKKIIPGVKEWGVRIVRLFIFCIGLTSILSLWGIQIAPIIAGFGVFGAGISFAAKDFFENIISGIVIMSEKKFNIGDLVKIGNIAEGHIKSIRIRSTEITQRDKAPIFIPNAKITNSSIINYTKMKTRIIKTVINLEYSTSIEKLLEIRDEILSFINKAKYFNTSKQLSTYVKIFELNESSIDLHIQCFTTSNSFDDFLATKESLNLEIMNIVAKSNASFAFPSQSLYIEKNT